MGITQGKKNVNDVVGVIKSVADVSLGKVTAGAGAPADTEGKVLLYQTSWCGYCKRAADYMRKNGIAFLERDIEKNLAFKAEYTRLGGRGPVPSIVMGTKTMTGFNETQFSRDYAEFRQGQGAGNTATAESPAPTTAGAATALPRPRCANPQYFRCSSPGQPSKTSQSLIVLGKGEEVIYMGDERDGFLQGHEQQR